MLIRPATASDARLLTRLSAVTMREAFGPPHNPAELVEEHIQSVFTLSQLEAELADNRSTFFLLENKPQTPVGYAKMRRQAPPRRMPEPYRRAGTAIEIKRIYLLNEYVGQGLGQLLMHHCLDWGANAGLPGRVARRLGAQQTGIGLLPENGLHPVWFSLFSVRFRTAARFLATKIVIYLTLSHPVHHY